jgi:hypothetical protein
MQVPYCISGIPRNFFSGGGQQIQLRAKRTGSRGGSRLVRGTAQFANEVVMDVFSIEQGIRLGFVKTSEFWYTTVLHAFKLKKNKIVVYLN